MADVQERLKKLGASARIGEWCRTNSLECDAVNILTRIL